MSPHLLNLPTELLERILALLCHENARSIQACRQACHSLNTIIAQSQLVLYLERVALLGMYDPLLLIEGGAASASESATLALPDRAAALRAWGDAWDALAGGDGDAGVFWQKRAPDLCITLPPSPSSSSPSPARVRYIVATIIDPDPPVGPGQEEEGHGYYDGADDDFRFGPWFMAATRSGINVRASYSYLDLHGSLDRVGEVGSGEGALGETQNGEDENGDRDKDRGTNYNRVYWTCVKVPVWHVLAFTLSTELDLAVVISCVLSIPNFVFSSLISVS
jgi:hypothetical protein